MSKKIIFDEESRSELKSGVNQLNDAVKVTFGPRGREVVLEESFGAPEFTKDGVTVAKEVELKNRFQNLGVQLVKEVAEKTQDETGDGTTTATILAHALIQEGMKVVASGQNPQSLRRGIQQAARLAVDKLQDYAREIESSSEIRQIATISANNDQEIGEVIAEAMEKVGEDGVITIEEGRGIETELDLVEGMQFDRGYKSPYFVTDDENMVAELEEPYILIYDDEISAVDELVDILEQVAQQNGELLIVAEDIDGDALQTLVVNKLRGQLDVAAVKAPGFGDRREQMLQDLAVLTGGELISTEKGMTLENTRVDQLGRAARVNITEDDTTVVEGEGSPRAIQDRKAQIERQIEQSDSDYDREKLEERLAKLAGGVAVVKMGAATEPEMEEKKARAEDALESTRAALEEGIIPGGGSVFLRVAQDLEGESLEGEEDYGLNILRKALRAPARQLADNAGMEGSVVVEKILENDDASFGFNAETLSYGDLLEDGVIDPAKVARSAIENASSISSLFITTEASVVEEDEDDDGGGPPGGGAPGGAPGGMPGGGGMGAM